MKAGRVSRVVSVPSKSLSSSCFIIVAWNKKTKGHVPMAGDGRLSMKIDNEQEGGEPSQYDELREAVTQDDLCGVATLLVDHGQLYVAKQSQQHEYARSEEHTSEFQSRQYLVCRLLLEKINIPLTT